MMLIEHEDAIDPIELIREGDVEDVALAFEAMLQRMGRMTEGELATVASLLRSRGAFGGFAVDAMTDVITSL